MHEAHLNTHLKREHGYTDTTTIQMNYEKFIIIPDMTPITKNISFQNKFVPENDRFRCGYRFCSSTSFSNFDELQRHCNRKHINETSNFTCPHCKKLIEKSESSFSVELFKHYDLHGVFSVECNICHQKFENLEMGLNHIIETHPNKSICYYSESLYCDNMCIYTISLQCCLCDEHFATIFFAIEHFVRNHKSQNMDFYLIRLLKRTEKDGTTICSTLGKYNKMLKITTNELQKGDEPKYSTILFATTHKSYGPT